MSRTMVGAWSSSPGFALPKSRIDRSGTTSGPSSKLSALGDVVAVGGFGFDAVFLVVADVIVVMLTSLVLVSGFNGGAEIKVEACFFVSETTVVGFLAISGPVVVFFDSVVAVVDAVTVAVATFLASVLFVFLASGLGCFLVSTTTTDADEDVCCVGCTAVALEV